MSTRKLEYQACCALITWWGYAHKAYGVEEFLLAHCPNQAGGNPRTGMHLKKMGVRAGWPDYMLMVPKASFKGMFVEMKSPTGVLSAEQKLVRDELLDQGYCWVMCRSSQEARNAIEAYLKLA